MVIERTRDVEDIGLDMQEFRGPGVGLYVDGHQALCMEGGPAHKERDHHGH